MKKILKALPWKRLYKVGKPFWVSDKRNVALLHLFAVMALLGANAFVAVIINRTAGNFMTAITNRSLPDFRHYLLLYAGAMLIATPIQVFYGYLRTRLALIWRSGLTNALFDQYFSNHVYYKLISNTEIDNPDQRMTQDVDSFCNSSVGLFISILDSLVNVATFITVLWMLSPVLTLTVLAYSALGSALVVFIGKALVGLNFQQMKTEADLRFGLAEVRREAEPIAFYRGEALAKKQSQGRLAKVIGTLMAIMNVNRNIQLFTTFYYMLVAIIPAAIIAPLYFHNKIPFGSITQATMAFGVVFNGATFLIGQFGGISSFTAIINRLGSFIEAVETCNDNKSQVGDRIDVVEGKDIVFDHVTIATPDNSRKLIVDLSLNVPAGQSLLIVGANGVGKTALMRVIANIWNSGTGKLTRPGIDQIMFLSQSPYLPATTLREALCYPCHDICDDNNRLKQILKLVALEQLPDRSGGFDTVQNWRDLLSVSEQQRLSLARIILRQPRYAILDEATSALEDDNERLVYTLLTSLGTTFVSVGSAQALLRYHTQILELTGNGGWKLSPTSAFSETEPNQPNSPSVPDAPGPAPAPPPTAPPNKSTESTQKAESAIVFPHGFVWGTGTSAYQVEGAWNESGKGESIWDRFSHTPGKIKNGDTGDIACDHYHLLDQDIDLAKKLNLNSYRFSIAWPRVQPTGQGAFNEEGIAFYERMIDGLLAKGIEPFVTLYHWDLPQALEDQGGWTNRQTCALFASYAAEMVQRFGDKVKFWTTFNEPWCTSYLGHQAGIFAPGLKDARIADQVAHNLLLAHGMAAKSMRATGKKIDVGIVLNLTISEPLRPDNADDCKLAAEAFRQDCGAYLDPLFLGTYPQEMIDKIGDYQAQDLATINQKLDFLGINFYARNVVSTAEKIHPVEGSTYTAMGWEVHAPSLRHLLNSISQNYGRPVMYVTENGAAFEDKLKEDGQIVDTERLDYLKKHIEQCQLAMQDGVDLRGYFAWSLMDNFEWAQGYSRRFGLVYVDYATQKRTVKASGDWFAQVAASNTVI